MDNEIKKEGGMHSEHEKGVMKLDLNVTNRCNLPCQHCCFNAGQKQMPEMPLIEIQKLLTEFRLQGGRRVDITGGEPLMRDDILQIIAFAKSLGLRVELVTNGTLLDEDLIRKLRKTGLDEAAISVDGANWQTNELIRCYPESIYKAVINNISILSSFGIKTKVNTVLFDHNLVEIPEITKNAKDWGAKEHGVYFFSPTGRGEISSVEHPNPYRWLSWIATMQKQRNDGDDLKISVETPLIEKEIRMQRNLKTGCFMDDPWHLQILPDGKVYPCAIMCHHGVPIGDLNKQSLSQIWQDKENMRKYYETHVKPMFERWGGCVPYPFLNEMDKNQFEFVCLCRKFKLEEVAI